MHGQKNIKKSSEAVHKQTVFVNFVWYVLQALKNVKLQIHMNDVSQ